MTSETMNAVEAVGYVKDRETSEAGNRDIDMSHLLRKEVRKYRVGT